MVQVIQLQWEQIRNARISLDILTSMRDAANSAALPTSIDVAVKYEAAMVFTIVTSHTNNDLLAMAIKSGHQVVYHLFEGDH